MAGTAGYTQKVLIRNATSTSTGDFAETPANTFTLNLPRTLLDDTDFTSTGYMSRLPGLKDYNLTGTFHFGATATPFTNIRDAWLNGSQLDFRYLPDGTNGFAGTVDVESLAFSADPNSLSTVDVTLQADGTALSTV